MNAKQRRTCRLCGSRIAVDNTAKVCSPCARSNNDDVPTLEHKSNEFWQRPAMAEAFRARHFGRVLYAYRCEHRPVLTQSELARALGLTQAQISRLETRTVGPNDLEKLVRWANMMKVPERLLWFRLSEAYDHEPSQESQIQRESWFATTPSRRAASTSDASITVEQIKETTETLRALDNRFGGGHARGIVGAHLANDIAPALHHRREDPDWVEFALAVAEVDQLAGWMAYDTGDVLSGRRHLQHALKLCQTIGERALAAEMLAGMSHQSAHAGDGSSAVSLARAARDEAAASGIAALESEAAVMEAHGLALLDDKTSCARSLRDAERAWNATDSHNRPPWLNYYDEAYLAAKMAHCFHQVGDLRQAEKFARRSLHMSAGYDRGKMFNTALLAAILADLGKVNEACTVGRDAVRLASSVESSRTVAYLRDVARRLNRYRTAQPVVELKDEMLSLGLCGSAIGQELQ